MAQTKIYPSTQAQVSAVDAKLDTIIGMLPVPTYQTKTANPSNVQQTVTSDNGYAALGAVVINPIAALMPANLEDYILRKDTMSEFSLSLSGNVPSYACYYQRKLVAVYGTPTGIGGYAFNRCVLLQDIDLQSATSVGGYAFEYCTALLNVDCRSATSVGSYAFSKCSALQSADCRSAMYIGDYAFQGCSALQTVDCRRASSISTYAFHDCSALQNVDFRSATSVGAVTFYNCSRLNILDFTSRDSAPTLSNTNAFNSTNNTWKAVFKNDTVKAAVQSATNWSTYASHIYTVAEIEALYGDTYDNLYYQWFGHARNEVAE